MRVFTIETNLSRACFVRGMLASGADYVPLRLDAVRAEFAPGDDVQRAFIAAAALREQYLALAALAGEHRPVALLGHVDAAWAYVGDVSGIRFGRYFTDATEGLIPHQRILLLSPYDSCRCDQGQAVTGILEGRVSLEPAAYHVEVASHEMILETLEQPNGPHGHWAKFWARVAV